MVVARLPPDLHVGRKSGRVDGGLEAFGTELSLLVKVVGIPCSPRCRQLGTLAG